MSGMLHVINPGALSLIQDSGRAGFQRYGVSVSGAMDQDALLIGNLLVGNEPDAAAIEVTFGGAQLQFEADTVASVTGADLQATLDGTPISPWESFAAPAGSLLAFAAPLSGLRAYLCVAGGIATEPVLGSRATHTGSRLGGLNGGPLAAGDDVPVGEPTADARPGLMLPPELRPDYGADLELRIIPGPQEDAFTDAGIEAFFSSTYTVTDKSDRQGVRLDGPVIEARDGRYDIVSDASPVGSVQVPGDAMPIVLLADRQTTGGYPKIGVVATVDLPKLAQAMPGTMVRFMKASADEARDALVARRRALLAADLSAGLRTRNFPFSIAGIGSEIEITFRPVSVQSTGGAALSARIDGKLVAARAEELKTS